jgi:hypothetical protein
MAIVMEELARVDEPALARVRLPTELRLFWAASLMAFVLTLAVGWWKYRQGQAMTNWNPLGDRLFGDLREYVGEYGLLHRSAFFFNRAVNPYPHTIFNPVAYPPFAAALMAAQYAAPVPEVPYLGVAAVWLTALVWWMRRGLVWMRVAGATAILLPLSAVLVSFPIVRLVHEGNIELVVWIFSALGVWAFARGREDAAAVAWGLAAAMKLFPLVLLGLLLSRRRYGAFGWGIATFVAATALSLWWLGPTMDVAWRGSLHNVFGYQDVRAEQWTLNELVANHSLFSFAKLAATMGNFSAEKMTLPYYACGVAGMAIAFFGRLWRMPMTNQVLGLSAFMVMLPTVSYYHTLVHLVAPLVLLGMVAFEAERRGVSVPGLKRTMILVAVLFAPFTLLTYPGIFVYCGMIQGLVLVGLLGCAVRFPFGVVAVVQIKEAGGRGVL